MDRPTFPTLIALVHVPGCHPQVMPLKGLPDWYAVAIPAGYSAYIVAPDASASANGTPSQIEAYVDEAAKRGLGGLLYGRWSVRVTRGAWTRLDVVRKVLVDVLSASGFLPMEPGTATVGDRARLFARVWTRRLLASPRQDVVDSEIPNPPGVGVSGNGKAGERVAHRPSYPLAPAAPTGNGELKNVQTEPQHVLPTNAEEPSQGDA